MEDTEIMEIVSAVSIDSLKNDQALLELSTRITETLVSLQAYVKLIHNLVEKQQKVITQLEQLLQVNETRH